MKKIKTYFIKDLKSLKRFDVIETEISKINPKTNPDEFVDFKKAIEVVALSDVKPLLEALASVAWLDGDLEKINTWTDGNAKDVAYGDTVLCRNALKSWEEIMLSKDKKRNT